MVPAPSLVGGHVNSTFHLWKVACASYLLCFCDHLSNAEKAMVEPLVARCAAIAMSFQSPQPTLSSLGITASAAAIKSGSATWLLSPSVSGADAALSDFVFADFGFSRAASINHAGALAI